MPENAILRRLWLGWLRLTTRPRLAWRILRGHPVLYRASLYGTRAYLDKNAAVVDCFVTAETPADGYGLRLDGGISRSPSCS